MTALRLHGRFAVVALCGQLLFAAEQAIAQAGGRTYPSRPVRVVVPYAPGGSSDTTARVLGDKLRELLGQQFVIDNRPGAAGSIGRELVAKASPDGYTLLVGDSPHTINVHILKHVPYDPIRSFTPITLLATAPQTMVVHPGFSAKTLKDFIAAARAQPGKLNYGSGGAGSVTHMTGELFKLATGANVVHVPYKSIALASADVIAGQMHTAFPTAPGIVGHVRGGRLRALAISTSRRSSAMPDVPTFEESGVRGMDVFNWFGVFAPAGLPKDTLARLHKAILEAMQSPDVQARFAKLSLDISTTTPEQFGAHLRSELERWGKVVQAAGIRAE